jgi:dihydrolipoamide dehydrogenase
VFRERVVTELARRTKRAFDARVLPCVAYSDPEVGWVGVTETELRANGTPLERAPVPLGALCLRCEQRFTKLLFDPETYRILGAGIVGSNAAEVALAIESGCDATDIGSRQEQCWSP